MARIEVRCGASRGKGRRCGRVLGEIEVEQSRYRVIVADDVKGFVGKGDLSGFFRDGAYDLVTCPRCEKVRRLDSSDDALMAAVRESDARVVHI